MIRVERGWDQYEGEIDPKSSSSRRTVPLLAVLRDYLDERLIRTGRSGDDLVFGRTAADPFSPPVIGDPGEGRVGSGRLDPITLHECRHTFASLLIDSGANPKAIQEFMGHSKIQTTFDTYGHLFEGSRDEVRRAHGRLPRHRHRGAGSCGVSAAGRTAGRMSRFSDLPRKVGSAAKPL